MKKYLYNLCVCVFSMTFVFQADETLGMNNSKKRAKQQTISQKDKTYNSSQKSPKKSGRSSGSKSIDEDFEDEEEDEFEGERRSRKNKQTLSELKECPCVQEYIKLTKDEEDEPTKKKLKHRGDKKSEEEDEFEDEEEERGPSRKDKSSGSTRSQYSSKKKEDESWKHKRADAGIFLEKYKRIPLFNKQYNIPSIKLAENSVSVDRFLDKNVNGNNEDKSVKENNDLSTNHKYKYRIDQKEAVKFRQDLEKYRQTYA